MPPKPKKRTQYSVKASEPKGFSLAQKFFVAENYEMALHHLNDAIISSSVSGVEAMWELKARIHDILLEPYLAEMCRQQLKKDRASSVFDAPPLDAESLVGDASASVGSGSGSVGLVDELTGGDAAAVSDVVPDAKPDELYFGIVDLKLTPGGKVKVLEFGRGLQSGFSAYISKEPADSIIGRFQSMMEKRYGVPCLITSSSAIGMGRDIGDFCYFLDRRIHPENNMGSLAEVTASDKLQYVYGGFSVEPLDKKIERHILKIDRSPILHLLCEDKNLIDYFFTERHRQYRPKSIQIGRSEKPNVALKKVQDLIGGSSYVVKLPNAANGTGVRILKKSELESHLRSLLSLGPRSAAKSGLVMPELLEDFGKQLLSGSPSQSQLMSALLCQSEAILVEEYCEGKPLRIGRDTYNPTMRAVFVLEFRKDKVEFLPIDAYWKLPATTIDSGSLEESAKSSIKGSAQRSAVVVSEEDKRIVFDALGQCLPAVIGNALKFDFSFSALQMIHQGKKGPGRDAFYRYVSSLSNLGEIERAFTALDFIDAKIGKTSISLRERGIAFYLAGRDSEALDTFDEALSLPDPGLEIYKHRLLASVRLGDPSWEHDFEMLSTFMRHESSSLGMMNYIQHYTKRHELLRQIRESASEIPLDDGTIVDAVAYRTASAFKSRRSVDMSNVMSGGPACSVS